MPYAARVIELMIASPSDVEEERAIARSEIYGWNSLYSREENMVLLPIDWKTHATPDLSRSAQDHINETVLARADMLIGVFWTRVGSPTEKAISGSVEEIERHVAAGKPAMLYFSNRPVPPDAVDSHQVENLREFREWAQKRGLIETFTTLEDFRGKIRSHIARKVREKFYDQIDLVINNQKSVEISDAAKELLKSAAISEDQIEFLDYIGGQELNAGEKTFLTGSASNREVAKWKSALNELEQSGLIVDLSHKGEIFELTHAGYELADKL